MERDPQKLAEPIARIRDQYQAAGRNALDLEVMVFADFILDPDGRPDLGRTLELVPRYAQIGVTTLQFAPAAYCQRVEDYPAVLERISRAVQG